MINIVVDTSVWSRALKKGASSAGPQALRLAAMLTQGRPVVLLGVIVQEVLSGIRDASDFEMLKSRLERFPVLDLDRSDYVAAARLMNLCMSKGLRVSAVDALIASACIEHDCALLTCDDDFARIADHCPLQLA